jgi:hypothetical protein
MHLSLSCLLLLLFAARINAAEAPPSPPAFAPIIEFNAPTIAAPVRELDALPPKSTLETSSPAEHTDITAFRLAQHAVNSDLQKRKMKPLHTIDMNQQPQFAHHCIKLVFSAQQKPQLENHCKTPVNIAYCWQGINDINGANDCHLNQYALSQSGAIYGPDEKHAHYGLFVFACTATGTPYQLRFDDDKKQIFGQCFW